MPSKSGSLDGSTLEGAPPGPERRPVGTSRFCEDCGAWSGTLGMEPTVDMYVDHLVTIFREVHRVLRPDGTLWLNIGDSYAGSWGNFGARRGIQRSRISERWHRTGYENAQGGYRDKPPTANKALGIVPKNLLMVPARLALALQADGWIVRSRIVWSKLNPMRESVRDRPTTAHEDVYLFVKGQWKTRVVKFTDFSGERLHLNQDLRAGMPMPPLTWSPTRLDNNGVSEICIRLAAAILYTAQLQYQFSLASLDSEIWEQSLSNIGRDLIGGFPVIHRAAVWSARLLGTQGTTKEFLDELAGLRVTLPQGDQLFVGGTPVQIADAPFIYGDGETTVAIKDAREVCKVNFFISK